MVTLYQLQNALRELGVETDHITVAVGELTNLLAELDEVEVKGRNKVDTLLGCMMAAEQIIGDDTNG